MSREILGKPISQDFVHPIDDKNIPRDVYANW